MKRVMCVSLLAAFVLVPIGVWSESELDDATPPELVDFSLDPTEVDVSMGPVTVACTARMTDDISGVDGMYFWFKGPSGQESFVHMALVSGTPNDGVYEGTATFEQYAEEGIWQVDLMTLWDVVGNDIILRTSALQGMGFPTDVSVGCSPSAIEPTSWGRLKARYGNGRK
jgi:hypothetical protein